MAFEANLKLPTYKNFSDDISTLNLSVSSSNLHGVICGYLCAGAIRGGDAYIRALMAAHPKNETTRTAALALFNLFAITEQQMNRQICEFELLLPDEQEPLDLRAKAFSEWCEGYMQGAALVGLEQHDFENEETKEALQHISEFANLDYQTIEISEEDERSFMEVCEYTRVAVMHIHTDLQLNPLISSESIDTH
jgi:uncharacterized protein